MSSLLADEQNKEGQGQLRDRLVQSITAAYG